MHCTQININEAFKLISLGALATCLTFSCGEDGELELVKKGGPFEISELAGNWEATTADYFRASDRLEEDIIDDGGSLSLIVQSNGRCAFTIDQVDRDA